MLSLVSKNCRRLSSLHTGYLYWGMSVPESESAILLASDASADSTIFDRDSDSIRAQALESVESSGCTYRNLISRRRTQQSSIAVCAQMCVWECECVVCCVMRRACVLCASTWSSQRGIKRHCSAATSSVHLVCKLRRICRLRRLRLSCCSSTLQLLSTRDTTAVVLYWLLCAGNAL